MSGNSRASFFEELKQRNVFRVGAAYVVFAWLLIQIADTTFPYIGIADRIVTYLIVVLAIGFIPVLVLAWVFELTPDGLVRDDEVEHRAPKTRRPGLRAFDYVVVSVLTVIVAVYAFDRFRQPQESEVVTSSSPSIAVLPFENRSANPEDAYFVDGVHDDILTSLANIGSLKVISRTSVEQFREPGRPIPEIGAELGVTAILEGGVQRAGDTIRINVQLIDVATDTHVWAQNYDRQLTAENVFAIQSEISTTIATALRTTLSPEEEIRLARRPTGNLEAYEAYLLGNQRIRRRTGASLDAAIGDFRHAISLDPEFALAWVGLADSYMLLPSFTDRDNGELLEQALTAVTNAIELDPGIGEAYATLGSIHEVLQSGVDPEPLFRRAIELSPSYAPARQWYGEFHERQDRPEEALAQFQAALELDPLSPIINTMLAEFYLDNGRPGDARPRMERAIEIDPQFARGYASFAIYFRRTGQWAKSLLAIETAGRLNPATMRSQVWQVEPYVNMGDLDAAARIIAEANETAPDAGFVRVATAVFHTTRSDDAAFQYALENRDIRQVKGFTVSILADRYLRTGRAEDVLKLLASASGYFSLPSSPDAGEIRDRGSTGPVMIYVRALQELGRDDEAAPWIEALMEVYSDDFRPDPDDENLTQGRLRYVVDKAKVHALNGDKVTALAALRNAVDAGWSQMWIYVFDYEPSLDLIRDEPAFQAMREELRAAMAAQLAAYRAGNVTVP